MVEKFTALLDEKRQLETEITSLLDANRLLTAAIGELAHDGRRLTDALERMGGQAADVQGRRRALHQNRRMSEAELTDIKARLAKAIHRLAEITDKLEGLDPP